MVKIENCRIQGSLTSAVSDWLQQVCRILFPAPVTVRASPAPFPSPALLSLAFVALILQIIAIACLLTGYLRYVFRAVFGLFPLRINIGTSTIPIHGEVLGVPLCCWCCNGWCLRYFVSRIVFPIPG